MMRFYLAASLLLLLSQAADTNVNTGSSTKCNNYIVNPKDSSELLPVGTCYQTNSNTDEVGSASYSTQQNRKWVCKDDGNGGKEAVEYEVGIDCVGEGSPVVGVDAVPCNGWDPANNVTDECYCEIGGDASECQLHIKTDYLFWEGFRVWCNRKEFFTEYRVINMCVNQDYGNTANYARNYGCGAIDYSKYSGIRGTGKFENYMYNGGIVSYTTDCSDSVPTASTTQAPTPSPTMDPTKTGGTKKPTQQPSSSTLFCSEATCGTFASPKADLGNMYNIGVAVVFVAVNVLVFG